MKVESLDHIHIYAAEPEDSARFYQHHFEAKPVLRNTNANGDSRIFLALGGQILVVVASPMGSPRRLRRRLETGRIATVSALPTSAFESRTYLPQSQSSRSQEFEYSRSLSASPRGSPTPTSLLRTASSSSLHSTTLPPDERS